MCGIAGILYSEKKKPSAEKMKLMGQKMKFRGPDDGGIYTADHIGLVHRRLAIRDLTSAGKCPMSTNEGQITVIFNGEIYNWRELRKTLKNKGYKFSSESDTEVLLQGYNEWGESIVEHLQGMFTFAIWDKNSDTLFIGRDRAGEKPLYYYITNEVFAFASNPQALLTLELDFNIDPVGLTCFLSHSFIPASHTAWSEIKILPPAHTLKIKPSTKPEFKQYWDFPELPPVKKKWVHCIKEIEQSLDDSVLRCLDADVPVGCFLSGGVDSSLITALAAKHRPDIKAFSLGFKDENFSELKYSKQVADHLNIQHNVVKIDENDVINCLPHLVSQFGQPFGDASAVPTYLLAEFARSEVKVALSGDGADELFGGYWRMQAGVYASRYAKFIPYGIRKKIIPWLSAKLGGVGNRLNALNNLSLAPPGGGYNNSQSWFEQLEEIAGPELSEAVDANIVSLRVREVFRKDSSIVQRLSYDDFTVQLPDAYLTKVDVASMAASLEVRAPFLYQDLMEKAWVLPDRTKLRFGKRKVLLKELATRYIPAEVIYRPKMGFSMPIGKWFKGRLGDYTASLYQNSKAEEYGLISKNMLQKTLSKHLQSGSETNRLWLLLWLELWTREVELSQIM